MANVERERRGIRFISKENLTWVEEIIPARLVPEKKDTNGLEGEVISMIIAFGYKSRQGKDTCGEAIVDHFSQKREMLRKHLGPLEATPAAKVFKFAGALYRVCREEYGMVGKDAVLLQNIGDGRRQKFGLNYWVNQLAAEVLPFHKAGGLAIITDVRYLNEVAWVKGQGGHNVNVTRLYSNGTPFKVTDRDPNHISEVQLDGYTGWDHYLVNTEGHHALLADQAITLAEYLQGLEQ